MYPSLSRLKPSYTVTKLFKEGISMDTKILSLHMPKQLFYTYMYRDIPGSSDKSYIGLSPDIPV